MDPSEIRFADARIINQTRATRGIYLERVRLAMLTRNYSGAWLAARMNKSASHVNACLRNDYGALPLNFIRACAEYLGVYPE